MFQTPVHITPPPFALSNDQSYLAMGSCFAHTIGQQLQTYKFDIEVNPFGIIFNPVSLFQLIDYSINNQFPYDHPQLWGQDEDVFFHYLVHSDLSALSQDQLEKNIKDALHTGRSQLEKSQTVILTLGTAIVYELKEGTTVANCHKVPSTAFNKRFLSTKEVINAYEKIAPMLADKNILLTVSPVRHAKEGLVENSTSKSILKYAAHILQETYANIYYFPAYEIMLDELRDYRFFTPDMLHPTPQAQEIIWEKFRDNLLDQETVKEIFELEKLIRSMNHKPFFEASKKNLVFMKNLLDKLKSFKGKADLTEEIQILEGRLNKIT